MANNGFSQKDLNIIEDQLTAESILIKKFETASELCTDHSLKDLCNRNAQTHKDHYFKLFNVLNSQG